uniref:Translocation protein SEC62 n=1 Tax=Parastrongyloides trichosuri TaxID=131310 RepID=A0A0N5A1S6_PARTI
MSNHYRRGMEDEEQVGFDLTKEEEEIAYYLRFNSGYKEVDLNKETVAYTRGDKMFQCLIGSSKYGPSSKGKAIKNEKEALNILQSFMDKKLFVKVEKKVFKKKDISSFPKGMKVPKKLKFYNVNHHNFDKNDSYYYLWNYNPVPLYKKIIGLCMIFVAIAFCLMPLWPESLRIGVYYLSVAAAVFIGFLFGLFIFQQILFYILMIVTCGRLRFLFLPNLIAECGFLESFVPLYSIEWKEGKTE